MFPMSGTSKSRAAAQGRMSWELQVAAAEAWCKSHVSEQSRMLTTGSISRPRQRKVMNLIQHVSKGSRAGRDRLETRLETSQQDRSKIQTRDRARNVYIQYSSGKA